MRRDVPPQKISKFHLFPTPVPVGTLEKDIYKISKDGEYVWTARGCNLEVFTCPHMRRVNHYSFPSVNKNADVYISSVEELPSGGGPGGYRISNAPHLLVVLSGVNYLCLVDICNATVLKCIQMPLPVSCLEVISYQGGASLQTRALFPCLRLFFGLVAVGTESGNLLLVDLCLDEPQGSDELMAAQVLEISDQAVDLPQLREQALEHNDHLCLTLSEGNVKANTLLYKGSLNRTMGEIISENSCITALHYVPHATLLAVGFSFGCFQLWNLQDLSVVYSSPFSSDTSPVVKFAFQEPENDPRNFCYLWVVYGQSSHISSSESSLTTASLYSLSYDRKDWQDGFGFLYQNFNHCILKFEHPLTTDPFNQANEADSGSSSLVAFGMIQDNHQSSNRQHDIEDPQADEWSNQDLSLCLMVWEAWEPQEPPGYFMLLFDINQWYQAQMPTTVRNPGLCSFLGVFSLVEFMSNRSTYGNFSLKDVHIPLTSLRRFRTLLHVDEVYYPSSFGFRATCLTDCGVSEVTYLGTQRQLLWELQNLGPSYLRDPTEIFIHCRHSGLLPYSENVSLKQKRDALLSLALEYDLLRYLKDCVIQSPTVDNNSGGLSLRSITDWAYKTTSQIKVAVDRLCLPLFNCSGQELHPNSLALLYNYSSQLQALACLYRIMQLQATQCITQAGFDELSVHEEVVQLLSVYLQVNLWLHQYCCLLPEHAEGEAYGENEVAYPASHLIQAYDQRRRELQKLHSSVGLTDLLLIDGLMSKLGDQVPLHWERSEGNGSPQRLYPPPSLYAFLNIYLVSGVPIMDKHCLTLYLLLDMADFLSHKQSHLEERLMQFPAAFLMPPSIVKIVQGFWMLDRKDFAKATTFLTDPVVRSEDLDHMLHSRVIKSLLFQSQERHALSYINIRKPPLDTPEDIKLHLSLLLANRLIIEAHNFQRQRSDEDLLNHFFLGCQQTGNMCALLELPLSPSEEQVLIKFLSDSAHPTAKEMLILYLLQRHRPLEALEFTDKLKRKSEPGSLCSSLVKQFIKILPVAQVNLAKELTKPFSQMYQNKDSVPLSSLSIKKGNLAEPVSRSHHLQSVKEALFSVWSKPKTDQHSPLKTRSGPWNLNTMPFVGSPTISESKNESELVYATPVGKRPSSTLQDIMESPRFPNKKSRGMDIVSPLKRITSERRESRSFRSEALLLLQTPPIKRVVPELKVCAPNSGRGQVPAPTSILKGSHSRTVRSDHPVNSPVVNAQMNYNVPSTADLSETDMELQECISVSPSEDADYEITEPLRQSLTRSPNLRKGRRSESPTLNINFNSPDFHNSDEVIVADESVTLNFSMQRRRENYSNLARRNLRARNYEEIFKSLSEQVAEKSCDTNSTKPTSNFGSFPLTSKEETLSSASSSYRIEDETSPTDLPISSSDDNQILGSGAVTSLEDHNDNITTGDTHHTEAMEIQYEDISNGSFVNTSESEAKEVGYSNPQFDGTVAQGGRDTPETAVTEVDYSNPQFESSGQDSMNTEDIQETIHSSCHEQENEQVIEDNQIAAISDIKEADQESVANTESEFHLELTSDEEKDPYESLEGANDVSLPNTVNDRTQNDALLPVHKPSTDIELAENIHTEADAIMPMEVLSSATALEPETVQSEEEIENKHSFFKELEVSAVNRFEETGQFDLVSEKQNDFELQETSAEADVLELDIPLAQGNALYPDETGVFEVNPVDPTSSLSQTACLRNSTDKINKSALLVEAADETRDLSVTPVEVKSSVRTRVTRRKARETIESGRILSTLRELSSVSSSDQSPSSSVFTTPEKASPSTAMWNTRLRPRSDSRASSDSSPQAIKESERKKGRTRQWDQTPSPQSITNVPDRPSGRKVTRSSRKTTKQRSQDIADAIQSPYVPEEQQQECLPSSIPEEREELPMEPETPKPALPFVFSPPSTRSWTRRKKSSASEKSSIKDKNTPVGIGLLPSKPASRHSEKETKEADTSSDWSNYINLISPFTGKEPRPRRSSISTKASTTSQHSMTLRTGIIKTRKSVKLK